MSTLPTLAPALLAPDDGEARWFAGHLFDWKLRGRDTGGALTVAETVVPAGLEPPVHVHERDDEVFYVLAGEVTVICGGRELRGGPGSVAFLPRGVPHGFRVDSATARLLVVAVPSGLEDVFAALGEPAPARTLPPAPAGPVDVAAAEAALRDIGLTVVGPPPSAPRWGAHLSA